MGPWRIVFLDRATLRAEIRPPAFPHQWIAHGETAPALVGERLVGAQVAITNKVPITASTLAALPELRLVAIAATGSDHVDLAACRERGVAVCHMRGYGPRSVAEHAFMLLLALRKRLVEHQAELRQDAWRQARTFCLLEHPSQELAESRLGLVGYGGIAQSMEAIARGFGMQVLVAERRGASTVRPGRLAFEEVLAQSDAISLHCPLTPETRRLIGEAELARMKAGAVLINTARGGLVDSGALVEALRSGHLAGAGIDVLEQEPPRGPHPLLDFAWPSLIVTPHVGWASAQAMQRLADQLIHAIEAFREGEHFNRLV